VKVYEGANVRNAAFIGHGDAGKTSLVAAMLYTAGATQRLGRVDDGTTVTDYDEEEHARSMSISSAVAYAEWNKTKLNLLDTPGFNMFVHEAKTAMVAAWTATAPTWAVCWSRSPAPSAAALSPCSYPSAARRICPASSIWSA
jgi:elongation factor G